MPKKTLATQPVLKMAEGYHPGNVTCDTQFKADPAPAPVTVDEPAPVLYDASGRPLRRSIGF